ncbi:NirD/YgiW/YdeI family stress tolerance protein [Pantoea sp.]|uniref:YgiW/YdeI family stress tolerance OB fold protein n=1 Tax=Pantoea sp. TaxID=69393 RepID=UPI00289984AB|nr:NirD/YgiW/YdeI family stress tolerance protein [Pantoea sp.]
MKKSAALLAIMALAATPALAAQQGGFVDPNAPAASVKQGGFSGGDVVTVKQAQGMKDDSWATIRGKIEKRTGDEDYLFRDATGAMTVEIDHKRWEGQTVSPKDTVELTGELDRDDNAIEMDVKQVKKIQ